MELKVNLSRCGKYPGEYDGGEISKRGSQAPEEEPKRQPNESKEDPWDEAYGQR